MKSHCWDLDPLQIAFQAPFDFFRSSFDLVCVNGMCELVWSRENVSCRQEDNTNFSFNSYLKSIQYQEKHTLQKAIFIRLIEYF